MGLAFNARALTLSPPTVEVSAKPGEKVEVVAKLYNEGNTILDIRPEVSSFTSKNETGQPDFFDDKSGLDLQHWITVSKALTLMPDERQSIVFTIDVPKNADPGGHYAAIFWGTAPPTVNQGAGIEGRIAMLILVNVEGDAKVDAKIIEFRALNPFVSHLPVNFVARFQNNGTVHVHPAGNIIIRNMLGRQSVALPFNIQPSTGNVLPKSIRRFDVSWLKNLLEQGAGEWRQEWNNFAFGHYTAELAVAYGPTNKLVTASAGFWVFPWMVSIVVLVVVVGVCFCSRLLIRRYKRHVIRQYTEGKFKK